MEGFRSYLEHGDQQQKGQQEYSEKVPEDEAADTATSYPLRDVEAAMLPLVRLAAVSSRIRIVRFDILAPKTIKELDDALDLVDSAAEQVCPEGLALPLQGVTLVLVMPSVVQQSSFR